MSSGVYSDPATQIHQYGDGRLVHFLGVVFLAVAHEQIKAPGDEVRDMAVLPTGDAGSAKLS